MTRNVLVHIGLNCERLRYTYSRCECTYYILVPVCRDSLGGTNRTNNGVVCISQTLEIHVSAIYVKHIASNCW